ncbi:uncharacterized protein [Leptinotarsa decemlineata]|uniref:uncharacterized protein n=1 Tax=Leptinotarsa decemlineata TaxID=7539 RepID=UPI003D3042CB
MKGRSFLSDLQKKALLNFMESEPQLCKGKFTREFTHQVAKDKWLDIASRLNSIPGAYKDWLQWRRTWQDMKKLVKRKRTLCNVILAQDEEKILSLIGDGEDESEDSKMDTGGSEVQSEQELIYVEYVNSHTDGETKPDEALQDGFKRNYEVDQDLDESAYYSFKSNRHFKRKRPVTLAERKLRMRETYCREKLMVMRRYYQERIRVEREIAKSSQRIACALEQFVTRSFPK